MYMREVMKTVGMAGVGIGLFFSDCGALRADNNKQYRDEVVRIERSLKGDKAGLFFIEIFSGAFPIPNRYEIVNGAYMGGTQLLLNSPPVFRNDLQRSLERGLVFSGNIELGSYQDYLKRTADEKSRPAARSEENFLVERKRVYGLEVERRMPDKKHWSASEIGAPVLIFIHNNKEYLRLVDSNSYLWETLLAGYGEINGIKK